MKIFEKLAIVLIALATIFSFAVVSADKPEGIPSDGPLSDISTILSDIFDILENIFGNTQSLDTDISTLQMSMDDNFTDVDSLLLEIQEDLDSSDQEVIYHTSFHYCTTSDWMNLTCRNTNPTTAGEVNITTWYFDTYGGAEWELAGYKSDTNLEYHETQGYGGAATEAGFYMVEIHASSKEIACSVCFGDIYYLPNDFHVQYL
jgi:hypothetical protein